MNHVVQSEELFVVIDDGHISIGEYQRLEPLVRAQANGCPNGLACFVVIPERATPPPAAVRHHLEGMLGRLPIRALAYLVEGTGFRSATTRGVLVGLGLLHRKGYPTKVFIELDAALTWLLPGATRTRDIRAAKRLISEARAESDWDEAARRSVRPPLTD